MNLLPGTHSLSENFGISSSLKGPSITTGDGKVYATARPTYGLLCFRTHHFPHLKTPRNFIGFFSDINVVPMPYFRNSFSTYFGNMPLSIVGFC